MFLIIVSLIGTFSCVSAADCDSENSEIISDSEPVKLTEIHVSADASDENGDGSSQNPFKSLKSAIANSESNATVYLNDGEYAGDNNRNITIDKSVTIIGKSKENTVINAESSARLFNVTPASTLTLINLTLINGYTAEDGGLIYANSSRINIINCIFKDSRSEANGGVIYNNLGALTIENSSFTNNSACDYGGVLYTLGTTVIKDSEFSENSLTSEWSVGACIATGGKIDLDGCYFHDCYSPYSAAAIINIGNATLTNCRFEKLYTDYTAGAISNHKNMVINNSYFGYNDVKYYAAAILAPPSGQHVTTMVYNTIFEKNHAGYHAAVTNNFKDTELYMQNCAIVGNYITLNKVYGDISLDDNATVQYCWWGQNEISPYYYSPFTSDEHPEKINASRWLVMTFTSENGVIYKNEINQLTVSLKQYFDNDTKEICEYDEEFNLPLDVTFYTDSGTVATVKLVNGVATLDYKPQSSVSAVYAKINNQILKIDDFQTMPSAIVAEDFEAYYGSSSKLTIKLVNVNNAPIANKKVTVNVGGIKYSAKTDENGIAKVVLKNKPKKYSATITFDGTNYIKSSKTINVKILKPTIKASKLKIRKKGKLTVTFKDEDKKAIKNAKVKFEIKGKTYVKKTNSKGEAKLTVNLNKGKYTVKVGFKNTKTYGTTTLTKKIKVIG